LKLQISDRHLKPQGMKDIFRLVGCLIFIVLMTSGSAYQPQMVDIPLINEKSEVRIDLGHSFLSSNNLTVTYALKDNIALQVYGNFGLNEVSHIQAAAGYFLEIGNKSILECYIGIGDGHANFDYNSLRNMGTPSDIYGYRQGSRLSEVNLKSYGNYKEYYTQLNYGITDISIANIDFGFSLKIGYLDASMKESFIRGNSIYMDAYFNKSIHLEPLALIRFGGNRLKISLKVGSGWMYNLSKTDTPIPYDVFNAGIGLNYKF